MSVSHQTQKLNDIYADNYTDERLFDLLVYLTNKNRGKCTTESHLRKVIANRKAGELVERLDPVAFNCIIQSSIID